MTVDPKKNLLWYGDNLGVLRREVADESVDLVYLDPPFNSSATYNILFAEQNGSRAAAQAKAFEDTWRWDQEAATAYRQVVQAGGRVSETMQGFRKLLGDNDMLAYLSMMAPRLVQLKRVLKPTGSIYLHCDPTASAHLRLLMDAVFGPENFRNEIIWHKNSGGIGRRAYSRRHDTLLFYSRSEDYYYNGKAIGELREQKKGTFGGYFGADEDGREYREVRKSGKIYKYYMDEPRNPEDVWEVAQIPERDKTQRLGYPTQKPEALLERIIKASSREGNLVLDPFCGCGTTIAVAERLGRRWIGIDITQAAIVVIKRRLLGAFGDEVTYEEHGSPEAVPDAAALAHNNPYEFQWWALGQVGACAVEQKKGADRGIDGRLYFHDEGKDGKTKQIILSVKSGNTNVAHLRDLRGVLDREKAEIGVLITMREPSQPMRKEAASGEFYDSPWGTTHPRLQILTVAELFAGKRIDMPSIRHTNRTFKKAPRAKREAAKNVPLPLQPDDRLPTLNENPNEDPEAGPGSTES